MAGEEDRRVSLSGLVEVRARAVAVGATDSL